MGKRLNILLGSFEVKPLASLAADDGCTPYGLPKNPKNDCFKIFGVPRTFCKRFLVGCRGKTPARSLIVSDTSQHGLEVFKSLGNAVEAILRALKFDGAIAVVTDAL